MAGENQRADQFLGENQDRFEVFSFVELAEATGLFNYEHILGDGACGEVFKGKINGDRTVAIKKLRFNSSEEQDERDFRNEFRALASTNHPNLVKLIGYCCEGPNRLIVCEFCSNESLRCHLSGAKTFPWDDRLKIAIGSAKGIEYLHDICRPKIIHRDIKPENIVLEPNSHAKVVDFGLAKFFPLIGDITHISSMLRGTSVYADADPEYEEHQKVSEKSDVYSFGVVLLELVSGQKPETDGVKIIDWARRLLRQALGPQNNLEELIDPKLKKKKKQLPEIKMMICCAAASVYKPSKHRPQMKQIVQALEMKISPNEIWDMDSDAVYLGPN